MDVHRAAAAGGRVRVYVGTSLESVREATASLRAGAAGRRTAGLAAARRGVVAAGRAGAAPPRPDPCRGRHHHRGRPVAAGRTPPTGHDEVGRLARHDEPDARPARAGPGAAAEVRRRRLPRPAQPADRPADPARGGDGAPRVASTTSSSTATSWGTSTRWTRWSGTCCSWSPTTSARAPASPLDLEDVVLEEAARVRRLGGPDVDTSRVSAAPVVGDPERAAPAGAQPGGERRRPRGTAAIELRASTTTARWSWTWSTTGRACPPARRRPCSNASTGRRGAQPTRGTGLGLSIARTIAERHGGPLSLVATGRSALPADPAGPKRRCPEPSGAVG